MKTDFIPIPKNLPPLPSYDASSHWPKVHNCERLRGPGSFQNEFYGYSDARKSFARISPPLFGKWDVCIEIVPINYADPCYVEYVRDAYNRGIPCEHSGNGITWEPLPKKCAFAVPIWMHRIKPSQPAQPSVETEPDYFSEEYQVDLFTRWRKDQNIKREFYYSGSWVDYSRTAQEWRPNSIYREAPKPPAPKFEERPLDDIKLSEVLIRYAYAKVLWVVTEIKGDVITISGASDQAPMTYAARELMNSGWLINRNGQWVKCSRQVEVGSEGKL